MTLQTEIVRLTRSFDGELGLAVKDLQSGVVYSYNGDTPFYLASAIKVAVLREVFRQADAGQLSLRESLTVRSETLRDGAPKVTPATRGLPFTLEQLVHYMITSSDNAATDMLIGRVGLESVNAGLASSGFGPVTTMLDVRKLVYSQLSPKALELTPEQVYDLAQIKSLDERAHALAKLLGFGPEPSGAAISRARSRSTTRTSTTRPR